MVVSEQKLEEWESIKTWKQWREYIQSLLQRSDAAVESALVRLYMCQEEDEKATGQSKHVNGAGFDKVDAYRMSRLAQKLLRGMHLSDSEVEFARAQLKKYWKQLAVMSKRNIKEQRLELEHEKRVELAKAECNGMEQLQLDLGVV